jgi:endonuclease YncB( thermonuclease family)
MSDERQGRGLATIVGHNAVQPTSDLRQRPITLRSRSTALEEEARQARRGIWALPESQRTPP